MRLRRATLAWLGVLAVAVLIGSASTAWATHRWGCWKYRDSSISYFIGATGVWANYFRGEGITDKRSWHNFTVIDLTEVGSAGSSDHANCYADFYGNNGWLGLAQITRSSGCTILQGDAFLNKTYLTNYPVKNRRHVACQEVGHLWGLDHNRNSNRTCMNDRILTAPRPNKHDQTLLSNIY